MKIRLAILFLLSFTTAAVCFSADFNLPVWPDNPPGETVGMTEVEGVWVPSYDLYRPSNKTTDACLIVAPGGAYNRLATDHEGVQIAEYFNRHGMTVVVLKYRVPRRDGLPKHMAAWQDAQRMVRVVRSQAKTWGINSEKIGMLGFSAGGHLTLMTATCSQTSAYEPVDEVDKLPCHLNFAMPIYPAYVLLDGLDGPNTEQGNNNPPITDDFAFDAKTPPMCLIHGDEDVYSSMGSLAVYHKLRTLKIPAELHVFAKTGHGFGACPTGDHIGSWLNRVWAWFEVIEKDLQ